MNKPLILDTVRGWVAKHLTPDVGEFSVEELQRPTIELQLPDSSEETPKDLSGVHFSLSIPSQASFYCWIATAGRGSSYSIYDENDDAEIYVYKFPEFQSAPQLEARLSEVVSAFLRQHVYEPTLDEWAFDKGGSYDFVKVEEFCGHAAHEDLRDRQWTFFNYKWPDSSNVEVVGGFDGLGNAATFYEPGDESDGFHDFDSKTHGLQNAQQFRAWLDKSVGRPETMDIKSIGVSNLFGKLSYRIPLKTGEGVTIIHAPNGCGKTTILHLVLSLLKGEFGALCQTRFDSLDLEFGDGRKLLVEQVRETVDPKVAGAEERRRRRSLWRSGSGSISEDSGNAVRNISAKLLDNDGELLEEDRISVEPAGMRSRMRARSSAARIVLRTPHLRLHGQAVLDSVSGEFLSFDEVVERYSPPATGEAKRWLVRLLARNGARLIRTQRLDAQVAVDRETMRGEEPETIPAVVKNAQELADAIRSTLAEFSNKSQKLDEDFLKKLLLPGSGGQMSGESLAGALADVSKKYDRVAEAGILAGGAGNRIPDLPNGATKDPTITKALGLYINNQREKLQVFDKLLHKVETLKELVNDRFQMKQLRVTPGTGYNVVSDDDESPIPLDRLSSGEQHQLVLFYSLVFGMSPGALIMIDEPEISLHVAWQEVFLRDLKKIARSTGAHFLIATHSPVIIGARWALTVGLGEQIREA